MDTQKDSKMANEGIYAKIAGQKTVVGAKQLKKAVVSGSALQVYLAKNADPAITEPLAAMCQQNCVEFAWVKSMTDLGRACGIEVGAAAAAAVR